MPRSLTPLLAAACLLALTCASPALAAEGAPAEPAKDELRFTQTATRGTLTPPSDAATGATSSRCATSTSTRCGSQTVPTATPAVSEPATSRALGSSLGLTPFRRMPRSVSMDASGRRDTDIVELSHPRYDAKARTMRYVAQTVPRTPAP